MSKELTKALQSSSGECITINQRIWSRRLKCNAGGQTHTKGHKHTISDQEDTITLTSKKSSKVSVPIRMLVSLTEFIFPIDGNRFLSQASCWEEACTVNSENIT